jgi:Na+/H+ antiporter NhaD/arsenite permease-like protein
VSVRTLLGAALLLAATPGLAAAAGFTGPAIGPVPVEFILFAVVLTGVGLFHGHTLRIGVTGAMVLALYKILLSPFGTGPGLSGFSSHLQHEWVILSNLFLLLVGFSLLARHFEESGIPGVLPRFLADDWKGAFTLLVAVAVLSSFLDNIAAALIGGAVAHTVFKGRVDVGYLAGIVAASNAGGAFSVVGDTTTTMMWIAGIGPLEVVEAVVGTVVAVLVCGIPLARAQQKYEPIQSDPAPNARIDWTRVGVVLSILALAVGVNVVVNTRFSEVSDRAPFLGLAVWVAILATAALRKPEWKLLPESAKGSIFLLSLVLCASMMPVEKLPAASWQTAFGLGFISAVFDNIPLTTLALNQGGYDWGFLAFAVGFGGSMVWFGSSAGVALSSAYPQMRDTGMYLRKGYWVVIAYVAAFFTMLQLIGFQPGSTPRTVQEPTPTHPATRSLRDTTAAAVTSPVTFTTVAHMSGTRSIAIRTPIPSAGRPTASKSGVSNRNAPRGTPGAANETRTDARATVARPFTERSTP